MRRPASSPMAAVRQAMAPDRSRSRNSSSPMSGPTDCRASSALQLFDAFCAKPETADVCQEATARKHLQRVVGDHINQRFVDDRSGDYRYALEVEIVMVYRVYLTGSIVDLRRTADSQKGGLSALWPFGSSQNTPPAAPSPYGAPPAAPYSAPTACARRRRTRPRAATPPIKRSRRSMTGLPRWSRSSPM